jgi:cytochrome c-type biogenesis protein CcmF
MAARTLAVMGLVGVGFLLFLLLTSNPFERLFPVPAEGRDLNPLLQDPGLAIHPPMLYMGYVGFSVAFALAVAALLGGHLDATWARWSRPWTTVAWVFLTGGITLGSWWAYYELGWGGWWFWDPVENASFMPWLVGTALIHSLAVTEKRGVFKSWTVLLAIFAFSLSLLGTFLVRSGVLTSVHAFATDPARGVFILLFLGVVVGGSLALYAWRAPAVRGGGGFALVSRENLLLANNVLLVVVTGTILLGTLYPLFLDALGVGKISVGPPYFDRVFAPLMMPLVFLMAVGPRARWRSSSPLALAGELRLVFAASVVLGMALPYLFAEDLSLGVVLGLCLAMWVAIATLQDLYQRTTHKTKLWQGLRSLPRSQYGMALAHIGLALVIVGITVSKGYSVERDVRLAPGDSVVIGAYTFRFDGVREQPGANYDAQRGSVTVLREGRVRTELHPEKRAYRTSGMPMTEAAIDSGLFGDLYVALGEPVGEGAWALRVYHKPFIFWLWLGGIAMAAGGLLAASDRRYRLRVRRPAVEPVPGAVVAEAGRG